jgi:NADH dehydrogenase
MNVVTGAFGYIGRYITQHLLDLGEPVRTITTHPDKPNPFGAAAGEAAVGGAAVEAFPYSFDQPDRLVASLRGAGTLYNTYWIRFPYRGATFEGAVENTRILFEAARQAGVRKIVHISVTRASLDSNLPYYRGKALQEQLLEGLGVPYSIVRPTLVYGREDILVNNIAWLVRNFPAFPIFGSGMYRLQPVFVGDLAQIAVECSQNSGNAVLDAIGPDGYTFEEFVRLIAARLKPGLRLMHISPALGIAAGTLIGWVLGDVLLTRAELDGLMQEMLTSDQPPIGETSFTAWLDANADLLGRSYTSEVGRHFKWEPPTH